MSRSGGRTWWFVWLDSPMRLHLPPFFRSFLPSDPYVKQERELGNDAFALGQYDAAIAHYARALHICGAADATLFSNRAAAYLAKGWCVT